jgi:hypothetical protein
MCIQLPLGIKGLNKKHFLIYVCEKFIIPGKYSSIYEGGSIRTHLGSIT